MLGLLASFCAHVRAGLEVAGPPVDIVFTISFAVLLVSPGGLGGSRPRFSLVVFLGAVSVPVFSTAVVAGSDVLGPGLLLVRGLALAAAPVAAVTLADELVLVRAGIAALALALLKLVAGLVLLACVVGVATATALDESGGGSL